MKGTYVIEVLSPVHIGCGQKYNPADYYWHPGDRRLYILDMERFFTANLDRRVYDTFTSLLSVRRNPAVWHNMVRQFPKLDPREFSHYSLAVENPGFRGQEEISGFIKSAGRPYVPGSSLKGAMRTALTRAHWSEFGGTYESAARKCMDRLAKTEHGRRRKLLVEADNPAEEDALGSPRRSPFRFLKLSDSEPIEPSELALGEIKILSVHRDEPRWFGAPTGPSHEKVVDHPSANSFFYEVLREGTIISGRYSLDLEHAKVGTGLSSGCEAIRNPHVLENLVSSIRGDVMELIKAEHAFYSKLLPHTAQWYEKLQQLAERLGSGQILLPLGWGTGILAKGVFRLLSQETALALVSAGVWHRASTGLFPKTRRLVVKDGIPCIPMGWVKLSLS